MYFELMERMNRLWLSSHVISRKTFEAKAIRDAEINPGRGHKEGHDAILIP
jgi:hypothetical protein